MRTDREVLTVRLCMCLIMVLTIPVMVASVILVLGYMDPIFDDAERDGIIGLLTLCMFLQWIKGIYEKISDTVKSSDNGTETGIETN